jgi:hypothetical protein
MNNELTPISPNVMKNSEILTSSSKIEKIDLSKNKTPKMQQIPKNLNLKSDKNLKNMNLNYNSENKPIDIDIKFTKLVIKIILIIFFRVKEVVPPQAQKW